MKIADQVRARTADTSYTNRFRSVEARLAELERRPWLNSTSILGGSDGLDTRLSILESRAVYGGTALSHVGTTLGAGNFTLNLDLAATSGLTTSGDALAVAPGLGIELASNQVAVDTGYSFDWTATHTWDTDTLVVSAEYDSVSINWGEPDGLEPAALRVMSGATGDVTMYARLIPAQTAPLLRFEDTAENPLIILTATGSLQSGTPAFYPGVSGWEITSAGNAEFNNVWIRGELHAATFVADEMHAAGGTLVVISATTVALPFTLPALDASGALVVNGTEVTGLCPFSDNDIVRIKWIDVGSGFNGYDVYLEVNGTPTSNSGRNAATNTPGTYSVPVIRRLGGATAVVVPAGTAAVRWGEVDGVALSYTGGILLTSDLNYAPYISVYTVDSTKTGSWGGTPPTQKPRVHAGRLEGLLSGLPEQWGIAAGTNLSDAAWSARYFVASDLQFSLHNIDIAQYYAENNQTVSLTASGDLLLGTNVQYGASTTFDFDSATGSLRVGPSTGKPHLTWNATTLELYNSSDVSVITLDSSGNSYFSGVMTIGASGEIRQGTGSLGSTYTGLRIYRDGNIGKIAGYSNNVVQWQADDTGRLLFAGGAGLLSQYGVNLDIADTTDVPIPTHVLSGLNWWDDATAADPTSALPKVRAYGYFLNGLEYGFQIDVYNGTSMWLQGGGVPVLHFENVDLVSGLPGFEINTSNVVFSSGFVLTGTADTDIGAHLIPGTDIDLGSAGDPWRTLYVDTIVAGTITGSVALGGQTWRYDDGDMYIYSLSAGPRTLYIANDHGSGVMNLDVEGNIVVGGNVDGVNVSSLNSSYSVHILDTNAHHAQQHSYDSSDHSGSLSWSNVNKTGSSIADLASHSHTLLTDIGTNSHATIDLHIAATAAHGATGAVVGTTNTQTLSNKTLTLPKIDDTSANHTYNVAVSELAANRTITLPLLAGDDTFVFASFTQTLANKTLTTPTIASFTNAQHAHTDAASGGTVAHSSTTGRTEDDHHAKQHAMLDAAHHTYTGGAQYDVFGLSAASTLSLLTTKHDVSDASTALLRSNSGVLTLLSLAANSVTTPLLTSTAELTISSVGDITLSPTGGDVITDDGVSLHSYSYSSTYPLGGYLIAPTAVAGQYGMVIGTIESDELHTKVFVADEVRISRGEQIWSRSYGIVAEDWITPAALGDTVSVTFEVAPMIVGDLFVAGEWLLFRMIDADDGIGFDVWGQVSGTPSTPDTPFWGSIMPDALWPDKMWPMYSLASTTQTWTFTLRSGPLNTRVPRGVPAVDYATSGQSYIALSVISPATAPYIRIASWSGANPYEPANHFDIVFIGNLNGASWATGERGIAVRSADGEQIAEMSDSALLLRNAAIDLYDGVTQTVHIGSSGDDLWIGVSPADKRLEWNGSVLSIEGSIVITGGSGYSALTDIPDSLADINADERYELTTVSAAVFTETWDDANALSQWEVYSTPSELVISSGIGSAGGNALTIGNNSGNDQSWIISNRLIPFDGGKTYRMRVRTLRNSGTGVVYFGFVGVAADGVTLVNVSGANSYSSQHYHTANGLSPSTLWTEYVGYTKGFGATVGTAIVGTVDAPGQMHPNVRYLRPMILANYNAQTGQTVVDMVTVEAISAAWYSLDGMPVRFNDAPSTTGLYLTSTHLGYYDASGTPAWKMWMASTGQFYFGGSSGAHLEWDGTKLRGTNGTNDQWWADSTTGKFLWGAGEGVLDQDGLSLTTYTNYDTGTGNNSHLIWYETPATRTYAIADMYVGDSTSAVYDASTLPRNRVPGLFFKSSTAEQYPTIAVEDSLGNVSTLWHPGLGHLYMENATDRVQTGVARAWDATGLRMEDDGGNLGVFVADGGNVGIRTNAPITSAALDISSTTGSLVVPRMTTTQRNALTAANGMIVYNTTDAKFQGYQGGSWVNFV